MRLTGRAVATTLALGLLATGLVGCGFGGSSVLAQQAGDEVRPAGDGPTSGADVAARPDVLEPGARVLARMGLPESPVQIDDASDLGPVVTLSPAVVNAAPGDIVEITVAIDPDGLTLTAFEVVVEIDTNAVEFAGLEAGRLLGGDVIVGGVEFDSATGRALITVARAGVAAGPTDSGSVATLQLEILGTAQAGESNVRVAVRVTDEAFSLLGPFLASAPLMLLAR